MLRSAIALAALALLCTGAAGARSRHRQQGGGPPGRFDYYVLSLSWSPQYCAGPNGGNDGPQCGEGRRYGFVVHGLWPQFERGYPENCAAAPPLSSPIITRMLPLMPSPQLIRHEWQAHGTCSGLDQNTYFDTIRRAYQSVHIPDAYKQPLQQIQVSPADIKKQFASANPSFGQDAFRVLCSGRFLSEVRVCFTKDLKGRPCGADARDTCRADPVILRPVR